jgi:hypothetical protein
MLCLSVFSGSGTNGCGGRGLESRAGVWSALGGRGKNGGKGGYTAFVHVLFLYSPLGRE